MPLWAAAQAVQVSAFPTAYAQVGAHGAGRRRGAARRGGAGGRRAPRARGGASTSGPRPARPAARRGVGSTEGLGAAAAARELHRRRHRSAGACTRSCTSGGCTPARTWGPPRARPSTRSPTGRVTAAGPTHGYGQPGRRPARGRRPVGLQPPLRDPRPGRGTGERRPAPRAGGSTGMSTAPHLHFEIRLDGRPIDPVPFMRARGVDLLGQGRLTGRRRRPPFRPRERNGSRRCVPRPRPLGRWSCRSCSAGSPADADLDHLSVAGRVPLGHPSAPSRPRTSRGSRTRRRPRRAGRAPARAGRARSWRSRPAKSSATSTRPLGVRARFVAPVEPGGEAAQVVTVPGEPVDAAPRREAGSLGAAGQRADVQRTVRPDLDVRRDRLEVVRDAHQAVGRRRAPWRRQR